MSSTDWQVVPSRETIKAGDRVRTGPNAAARIVYFEGTVIEVGAETGLLVQQLERAPSGGLRTRLFQSLGTTLSRVVHLVDPSDSFGIETPASVVMVRGTTPRVEVVPDGTTQVGNIPDGTNSLVVVQGKDPARTEVRLQPGQQTRLAPGQPPTPPSPIGSGQATATSAQPTPRPSPQPTSPQVEPPRVDQPSGPPPMSIPWPPISIPWPPLGPVTGPQDDSPPSRPTMGPRQPRTPVPTPYRPPPSRVPDRPPSSDPPPASQPPPTNPQSPPILR